MDLAKIKNELAALADEGLSDEDKAAIAAAAAVQPVEEDTDEKPKAKPKKDETPRFNGLIETDHKARGFHLDVQVNPDQVVHAAEIVDQNGLSIETITGVDWIKENQFEVVYDYAYIGEGPLFRVVIRARVDRDNPDIPTVSEIFPGANWHERETWDLLGINFVDHPQLERFLLPEDCDFHPLRKDFQP